MREGRKKNEMICSMKMTKHILRVNEYRSTGMSVLHAYTRISYSPTQTAFRYVC